MTVCLHGLLFELNFQWVSFEIFLCNLNLKISIPRNVLKIKQVS